MKRLLSGLMALFILFTVLPASVFAADTERAYDFDLSINGEREVQAKAGDVLTATLTLKRTDKGEGNKMYAMQDEIWYDDSFFEIVPGSVLVGNGVETTDIALQTGGRALYLNFLSINGGAEWDKETMIGSFQLKVIADTGASTLKNQNAIVSTKDGADAYSSKSEDVTVVVTTDCVVHFETNGGSEIDDVTVHYGDIIPMPEDPKRDGFKFDAWYKDINQTEKWDFDKDTVKGNVTLYAGWLNAGAAPAGGSAQTGDGLGVFLTILLIAALMILVTLILFAVVFKKKTVDFVMADGTEIASVLVRKGEKLNRPRDPEKEGCTFAGWYYDATFTEAWDFDTDTVKKDRKLYAKWDEDNR